MVQASQLPMSVDASGCSGLWSDHCSKPLGGMVCSGSIAEVDQSAGGKAVGSARGAPEEHHSGQTAAEAFLHCCSSAAVLLLANAELT